MLMLMLMFDADNIRGRSRFIYYITRQILNYKQRTEQQTI